MLEACVDSSAERFDAASDTLRSTGREPPELSESVIASAEVIASVFSRVAGPQIVARLLAADIRNEDDARALADLGAPTLGQLCRLQARRPG